MQQTHPYGLMAMDPGMRVEDLDAIMREASQRTMETVCLPPMMIRHAKAAAQEKKIGLATMIGFPYGFSAIESKLAEMVLAIVDGADELYVCANITAIKNNDWQYIAKELGTLMPVARNKQKKIFYVTEIAWLSPAEIVRCADLFGVAGVDGIIAVSGLATCQEAMENLAAYRKHLAEAVPLYVTLSLNDNPDTYVQAGANGLFVKSDTSLGINSSLNIGGMVFDQLHQN